MTDLPTTLLWALTPTSLLTPGAAKVQGEFYHGLNKLQQAAVPP